MKGQTSTEYLIILAIGMIIVTSAIGMFMDVPSLLNSMTQGRTSEYWQNADISIISYSIYSDGTGYIKLKSRKGYQINLNQINIDDQEIDINQQFNPGEEKTLGLTGIITENTGNNYQKKIWFAYTPSNDNSKQFIFNPDMAIYGTYQDN